MSDETKDLERRSLFQLQTALAQADWELRRTTTTDLYLELVVLRRQNIRLRIDGVANHVLPHLHVDYGPEYHVASYAIDTGERLAGKPSRAYDKPVREWIGEHKAELNGIWDAVRSGTRPDVFLLELEGSPF